MINKYAARLQRSYNLLHKIEQHIHARGFRYLRRSMPVFFTQKFSYSSADVASNKFTIPRDAYITNNGDHCWITEIKFALSNAVVTGSTTVGNAVSTESGFYQLGNVFDFVWNFKLNSTDAWYRQNAFGTPDPVNGCWSQSAGFSHRNNKLIFSAPLKFVSGDSLMIRLRATQSGTAIMGIGPDITFTVAGFRSEEQYAGTEET